jgi:predicted nucleic acid-binding protein
MTVLVDSDILIEVSRGRNEAILSEWGSLCESRAVILYSPVSAAELLAGPVATNMKLLRNYFFHLTVLR